MWPLAHAISGARRRFLPAHRWRIHLPSSNLESQVVGGGRGGGGVRRRHLPAHLAHHHITARTTTSTSGGSGGGNEAKRRGSGSGEEGEGVEVGEVELWRAIWPDVEAARHNGWLLRQ